MNKAKEVAMLFKAKNSNFKFITVMFQGSASLEREYTYKTVEDVDVGQHVIVPTVNGTQIAIVRRIVPISQVNFNVSYAYRFVIGKLDKSKLIELEEVEAELQAALVADFESKEAQLIADTLLATPSVAAVAEKLTRL